MHDDDSDASLWNFGGSRLVTRRLQASDGGDVTRLASRNETGARFEWAFRNACERIRDDDGPWIDDSLTIESPAGGLLAAGLHTIQHDLLHEVRSRIDVILDPDVAESALASVFLDALERAARERLGQERRLQIGAGFLPEDAPGVLRWTVHDEAVHGALARARGFERAHAEDDLACERPTAVRADALSGEFRAWDEASAPLFFRAYNASFQDRPGFPGWSERAWQGWTLGDGGFCPELSRVLLHDGEPVAFRTVALEENEGVRSAYVIQLGVVPGARRGGIARALLADLGARLGDDVARVTLSVNVDNPEARALFEACGFERERRRTVYRKVIG